MRARSELVGRQEELARVQAAIAAAQAGAGGLLLLAGEAGVGKTRLLAEATRGFGGHVLHGAASATGTPPFGAVTAAMRGHLRVHPDALDDGGVLRAHLAQLLPELGDPAPAPDGATLAEAVRAALCRIAQDRPALVVLDDLHWSDQATLGLLPSLALDDQPLLVLAAYRSDGLARDHPIRRLRHELRRAGRLDELVLERLTEIESAELLGNVLGTPVSAELSRAVHDRTQGTPFFVEEVAAALQVGGTAGEHDVPIPETVRDAVLLQLGDLPEESRDAAEAAAVAGVEFDLELVEALAGTDGITGLLERGLVRETGDGRAAFPHALTRDAIYAGVPWLRRRSLHRRIAEAVADGPAHEVAGHWLGAREPDRARAALVQAAEESEAMHAYRDAADAWRRALELWPERLEDAERTQALRHYAVAAERAAELAEAARAWRELAEIAAGSGATAAMADAQRHLAAVHDLRGDREAAFAARRSAADAFAAAGAPADAAVERLSMANQARLSARHGEAVELARAAREQADAAGRVDLRARALGLEGLATAKLGDHAAGVEVVRDALTLALEHDLTAVAAELYQRLGVAIYDASDYAQAHEALDTALDLCRATGESGMEVACVACVAYVLRERGDWAGASEVCHELISSSSAVFVAEGLLGSIHAGQGRLASARRLLTSSLAVAVSLRHYNMTVDSLSTLARLAAAERDAAQARLRVMELLDHWRQSDDHHYAVGALRWSAAFLAQEGDLTAAHACVEALGTIASESGYPDALAALGHAIAETALAGGDVATASEQLSRAVELHRGLELPFQRAEILLRAGAVAAVAGQRESALERLSESYRIARRLGARPLAAEAANAVAGLGESVAERLGRRAAADAEGAGLTRRELDVVRRLAAGGTNKEIAGELFLSTRTVDMHVRNLLRKLDCRTRTEAATKARELGLA